MHPIKFDQAYEKPLGAGDNPNTGDLHYCVARDNNTLAKASITARPVHLISCWQLSPEELKNVQETGVVYLAIMAHEEYRTQVPVSVMGFNPFTDYGDPNNFVAVPRTLSTEQVANMEHLAAIDRHVITQYPDLSGEEHFAKWMEISSPIALGNIECLIRVTIASSYNSVESVLKFMLMQDFNNNDTKLPPMINRFIQVVISKMKSEKD